MCLYLDQGRPVTQAAPQDQALGRQPLSQRRRTVGICAGQVLFSHLGAGNGTAFVTGRNLSWVSVLSADLWPMPRGIKGDVTVGRMP
jgi:hypothetical protein